MPYQWTQNPVNGVWLYADPAGMIAAQVEYNGVGRKEWIAYDLTNEGPIPKIGTYSELEQAKNAVEAYFQPPAWRPAIAS